METKIAKDKYKIQFKFKYEEDELELTMNVKILKHGEENCIEFNRMSGDCMIFYEEFNEFKTYLDEEIDTF